MKPTTQQKLVDDSLDIVPHADRTNSYNTEGTAPAANTGQVSQVAYHRFLEQGSRHGHDVEHWIEAEALLQAARSRAIAQRT